MKSDKLTNHIIIDIDRVLTVIIIFLLTFTIKSNAQTISKPQANYPYLLYLPKEYTMGNKNFPLIIYLGGGSQKGNDLNKLKTYGIPYYIQQGHEYPFIIASPQCPDGKYWTTENWFDSLYSDLITKYKIDTTRIYVTGISEGGFGTWQVAMDYPDMFAAIVPLCGGVNNNDTINIGRLNQLPVWTFHGTADDLIPIGETERIVSKLEASGNIQFTRLPNEGHGIQYLYADNKIFDWLWQHSKKKTSNILEQKLAECGKDHDPKLTSNEAIFLNEYLKSQLRGFDFKDKSIVFATGSDGSKLSSKSDYFNDVRKWKEKYNSRISTRLHILQEKDKLKYGYDALVSYWTKVNTPKSTQKVLEKAKEQGAISRQVDSLLNAPTTKPFNGIVLISQNEKISYSKACGYSDIEKKNLLKLDNQFVIGSISKQITAVIVLQEYEKGHLKLNTPIRKYLPELVPSWADTVTIHHLLTHTHGIVELDQPTAFKVGSAFNYGYSSLGYDLLARIVEKTSGKTFAELSKDLFTACGMKNTFYPEKDTYPDLVKGYTEQENGELKFNTTSFNISVAAGAFISTAEDLMLWNKYLHGGKLLKARTYQLMTAKKAGATRNHPIFGETYYGYGITVDTRNNILQLGQTGYIDGFVSMDFYFPKTKTSVIVLDNIVYDKDDLKKAFSYHTQILNIIRKYQPTKSLSTQP